MVANSPYGVAFFTYEPTQPNLSPQMITDMQNAGITRLRVQLPWSFIDPSANGAYLWGALDDIVSQINTAGLYVTFVFEKQPIGYSDANAGPYTGTISSGGGQGSQTIVLTAAATHLYWENTFGIIVSGGGNPPEVVPVSSGYSDGSATIPLSSGLRFGGRTTVQWYGYPDGNTVATFATALATRYNGLNGHGYIDQYEVGNEEWDSQGASWQSDSNTILDYFAAYGSFASSVASAIKAASPNAVVGTCALWWNQSPHVHNKTANLYATGQSTHWDYTNFHFYPYESGTHAQIDPVRPCYGIQNASVIPSFPQEILDMSSVMVSNGDGAKPVYCTEIGWYTYAYPDTRDVNSAVSSFDTQARCYFISLECARKSGVLGGFSFWTLDYATPYGGIHGPTNAHYSDGDSLVQITYSGNTITSQFYTPAFYQLKAYTTRWPNWTATQGSNAHTFLAFDSFINIPNYHVSGNINPNQRTNVALSTSSLFGTPSCTSYSASTTTPNTFDTDWIHYGSGTPLKGFQNDEGQLASSTSGVVDYFRLGSVTSVNQELVLRISTANANDRIGLCARLSGNGSTDSAVNCYQLYVVGATLIIAKTVNGTTTTLASGTVTQTSGKFYWMRFSVTGTTNTQLSAYFWICDCGTVVNTTSANSATVEPSNPTLSVVDSASPITTASGFGFAGLATTSTPIAFDTFMATSPVSAATLTYKAVSSRLRLSVGTLKNITTRLYLNFSMKNIATRFNLVQVIFPAVRNLATRLRLKQQAVTYVTDNFQYRSITGSFGTASDGVNTWTTAYSDAYSSIFVGSFEGRVCSTQSGTTTYTRFTIGSAVSDDTVVANLKIENSGDILGILVHFQNNTNYYQMQLSSSGVSFGKVVAGSSTFFSPTVSSFSPTLNTTYTLKCKSSGSSYFCKVWNASSSEPATWNAVYSDSTFPSGLQGLYFYTSGAVPNYGVVSNFVSAVQPDAIIDVASRLSLSASSQKFFVNRVSIGVLSIKDYAVRLRLQGQALRMWAGRVLLSATVLRNLATRFNVSIGVQRFFGLRVRLLSNAFYVAAMRLKLLASTVRDYSGRAKIQDSSTRNTSTRTKLQGTASKNVVNRVPLSASRFALWQSRLRLQGSSSGSVVGRVSMIAAATKNAVSRVRVMVGQVRDFGARTLIAVTTTKNTPNRVNIGHPMIRGMVGRIRIMTGQVRDFGARARIQDSSIKNTLTRTNIGQVVYRSLSSRINIAIAQMRTWNTRVALSQVTMPNLATRLKLKIPGTIIDFFGTRLSLIDTTSKNLRNRVSIAVLASKNVVGRVGFKDVTLKTMGTRVLLSLSLVKNINARLKLRDTAIQSVTVFVNVSTNTMKTMATRTLVSATKSLYTSTRMRLSTLSRYDLATRLPLRDQRLLFASTRTKLAQDQQRNIVIRVPLRSVVIPRDFVARTALQDNAFKVWRSKAKISVASLVDIGARANIAILRFQMTSTRFLLSASRTLNYQARIRLFDASNRYVSTRATLRANASVNTMQRLRLSDSSLLQRFLSSRVNLSMVSGRNVSSRMNLLPTYPSGRNASTRLNIVAYPVVTLSAVSPSQAPSAKTLLWYVGETYPLWNIALFSNAVPLDLSALSNDAFVVRFSNPQTATDYAGAGTVSIIRYNPGIIEYHLKATDVMAESTFDVYLGINFPTGDFEEFFVTTLRVVPLHTRNLP